MRVHCGPIVHLRRDIVHWSRIDVVGQGGWLHAAGG
jgi:hypothetical protein